MIEIALFAQTAIWLITIAVFIWSKQASVFHPALAYLLFHGLVFVVRPILVYYFNFNFCWIYMEFQPSDAVFIKTLAVTSLAMICIVGVSVWAGRTRLEFGAKEPPSFTIAQRTGLKLTTLLLLPLIAFSIYATRNGVDRELVGGTYIMTNSTGYINEAQDFIMPLMVIWMVVTRFHWLNLFPSLIYIGYRSWYGWSRWTILLYLLIVIMCYCWYHRRRWVPFWSILVAIPVLLLFNLIGHNRDMIKALLAGEDTHAADYSPGMTTADRLRTQLDNQDFANFDFLTYVVWVVPAKTETYTFWAQYAQLFTEPVPRILWKGKPAGSPVRTINIFGYANFLGLTVSLAGDGWLSGGWIGVIIELSVVGLTLGWAHRQFWRPGQNSINCLMYIVAIAMVPQWYRDGGISIFKFLLFTVTPVLVWKGCTWLTSERLLPVYSEKLPSGTRIRLAQLGKKPDRG
jgi:hypothetical protein